MTSTDDFPALEPAQTYVSDPVRDHLLRDTTQDEAPQDDATTVREAAKPAAGRKLPGRRCQVTLAGLDHLDVEASFEVRIDNRDYLRWDKTAPRRKWGSGRDVPFLMATFLAWSASTRAGLTQLGWEEFEARALEVENVPEEDEDSARPTR